MSKLSMRVKMLMAVAVSILGFVIFVPNDGQTVEASREVSAAARAPAPHARGLESARSKAKIWNASLPGSDRIVKDSVASALFSVQSWYVAPPAPPPAPMVVQAPPPPSAPPLPFSFMGSYKSEDGTATFFLTSGDRVYDVKVGDTVENIYSVDGVNAGQLLLTYMPLKIQQTLAVGAE